MTLKDYTEMAQAGIDMETIHKIHTQKTIDSLKIDNTEIKEAIITCPKCGV